MFGTTIIVSYSCLLCAQVHYNKRNSASMPLEGAQLPFLHPVPTLSFTRKSVKKYAIGQSHRRPAVFYHFDTNEWTDGPRYIVTRTYMPRQKSFKNNTHGRPGKKRRDIVKHDNIGYVRIASRLLFGDHTNFASRIFFNSHIRHRLRLACMIKTKQ